MVNSILVAVHPGFWTNEHSVPIGCKMSGRYLAVEGYGDYYAYRSNLAEAVRSHKSTVLFIYRNDEIPTELGCAKHIIHDGTGQCVTSDLIDLLRKENAEKIILCGEFVWFRPIDVFQALGEYSKGSPEKSKKMKESFILQFDYQSKEYIVKEGCVVHVYRSLMYAKNAMGVFSSDVEIKVDGKFCYPTFEATKRFLADGVLRSLNFS